MSDSSDDEPLAAKKAKLEKKVGEERAVKQEKAPVVKKEPGAKPVKAASAGGAEGKSAKVKTKAKNAQSVDTKQKAAKVKREVKEEKPIIKRERKVYDLPGQTRETPDELDPLRKFYSSLKTQRPQSQMARKWLCMYGLLSVDEAEVFLKEAGKSLKSPVKRERSSQASKKNPAKKPSAKKPASVSQKKAASVKREKSESESEDEVLPAKKQRVKKEPASTSQPQKKKATAPKGRFAVFEDGGMNSDSDDDKPLGQRV